ncbi:MAG: arginine--tRNA ligase [Desulfotalea sp.]
MIRSQLKELLDNCFKEGIEEGTWSEKGAGKYTVELPKREGQGDYSTNISMVLAGIEKRNPREIAAIIAEKLSASDLVEKVDIAGPGFVNITIKQVVWQGVIAKVKEAGENFGHSKVGVGRKVLVEFVSANPTGPLSIGHGRQAILGDSISRLLEATGHNVYREYYYNNAGRQMRVLGESTRARYLQAIGAECEFPEDGYQGQYIADIAQTLIDEKGDSLKDEVDVTPFKEQAENAIFKDISGTLERLGIFFDNYYNERSLYENGHIDTVVQELRDKGLVYEKDGAVWFETTKVGQEQDRVIIKSSGEPTYRLPDIAYHREKFKRDFDWLIDIFGSDHIATVPDVLSGVKALGYNPDKVTVVLHQFVTLTRDGKQVKMSTRKANFVTVDELVDEVGEDVLRFFFMMRKPDSQLEFDLDLATSQSQDNPVYYVQYALARICSILRQSEENGIVVSDSAEILAKLVEPEEIALLKAMAGFPAAIENAALELSPHKVIFYLTEMAGQFHSYYNKHKVITEDLETSQARLALIQVMRITLKNCLDLLGLSAPEKM